MNAAEPKSPLRWFGLRWREPLGRTDCPYLYRWVFLFFGFGLRIHHWVRSDDKRWKHTHPWPYLTIILKGSYKDVYYNGWREVKEEMKAGSIYYRNSKHAHYVEVPQGGCWTILLTPPAIQKWGFWVNGKFLRPIKYFRKFGVPPCSEQ